MEVGNFERYLGVRKLKLTPERKVVLQEMLKSPGHLEAEELIFNLRRKRRHASRATVYRTLELLVDSGMVRKVDLGHGHSHFEMVADHPHHEHMVCLGCGKVLEFSDRAMEEALGKLCQKSGFDQVSHMFQVFGYCEKCKRLKRREAREN